MLLKCIVFLKSRSHFGTYETEVPFHSKLPMTSVLESLEKVYKEKLWRFFYLTFVSSYNIGQLIRDLLWGHIH
jgi:hypothetical protein